MQIRGENGGGEGRGGHPCDTLRMAVVHIMKTDNQSKLLACTSYKMAAPRFAERGKDNIKEIDAGVKNAFKWEWMEYKVDGGLLGQFIRKLFFCGKSLLYTLSKRSELRIL